LTRIHKHTIDQLETFKDLFDNANDLIHLLDPDGRIIYVNNAWQKVLQFSQEEIEQKVIYDFVTEEDRPAFKKYREQIVNGQTAENHIVVSFLTKDNRKVYLEGTVTTKSVHGMSLYTRGIFRDVTKRIYNEEQVRKMTDALRERESNLNQLLHFAPDAIIVIDTSSRIQFWNPKAETIFGYKSEQVVGRILTEVIIPPRYRDAHDAGMKRFLATGEGHVLNKTIEISALDKAGREFFVALTISTTFQNGERAFIAFLRDIDTAMKDAIELAESKRQLEVSNQRLEQFAHVISHDMKEPIRKIMMFLDRLRADENNELTASSSVYFSKINNSATRLMRMIDGILEYSSIKGERFVSEPVDLNEVVDNVIDDLEVMVNEKHAVITRSGLPAIGGSKLLLYQLFYNLISNALKFARTDVKPVISVTSAKLDDKAGFNNFATTQTGYYQIVVSDNGIGFSQNYAQEIFKTFSRLHARDKYEGTGLGLFLCKTIVEKHHGTIAASGSENGGAIFTVVLPENGPNGTKHTSKP